MVVALILSIWLATLWETNKVVYVPSQTEWFWIQWVYWIDDVDLANGSLGPGLIGLQVSLLWDGYTLAWLTLVVLCWSNLSTTSTSWRTDCSWSAAVDIVGWNVTNWLAVCCGLWACCSCCSSDSGGGVSNGGGDWTGSCYWTGADNCGGHWTSADAGADAGYSGSPGDLSGIGEWYSHCCSRDGSEGCWDCKSCGPWNNVGLGNCRCTIQGVCGGLSLTNGGWNKD